MSNKIELPRIIGICGGIGHGKDTAADYLVEQYGYKRVSWADPLKFICHHVYGPIGAESRHFFGTQADKDEPLTGITDPSGQPQTGRKILEHIGEDGFRFLDRATWLKHGLAVHIDALSGQRWVISDVRYANEFEAIRSRGGVVWQVLKVGGPETERGHGSDQEWRKLPKDAIVAAVAGDFRSLRSSVDETLFSGGRLHEELLRGE